VSELLKGALINSVFELQQMLVRIISFLPHLVVGLVVLLIALFVSQRLRFLAERFVIRRRVPPSAAALILNTIRLFGVALAITVALYATGANVFGLVAGLGISGLVIGFALKDIIENFLAGVLLLLREPFRIGDLIKSDEIQGHVMEIDLHATTIKTLDNLYVEVPNSLIYKQVITNFSVFPMRRREVTLDLAYEDNLQLAIEGLLAAVSLVEGVSLDPIPRIELKDFGEAAVRAVLYYHVDVNQQDVTTIHNRVLLTLHDAIRRMKLALPYPTQTVLVQQISGGERQQAA
jgi:small conductance mechanosensitive channel